MGSQAVIRYPEKGDRSDSKFRSNLSLPVIECYLTDLAETRSPQFRDKDFE
jgi:hypothetical protein